MTEKTVGYSYINGHWVVEMRGLHKYPKLSFFMTEEDAKSWVEVLNNRHNLKAGLNVHSWSCNFDEVK